MDGFREKTIYQKAYFFLVYNIQNKFWYLNFVENRFSPLKKPFYPSTGVIIVVKKKEQIKTKIDKQK